MSSPPYRSVSAEIENMNLAHYSYSTLNKKSCGKYFLYSVQIVFYGLTPRSFYDEFMMYNFQLSSLHEQSILTYLGYERRALLYRHKPGRKV